MRLIISVIGTVYNVMNSGITLQAHSCFMSVCAAQVCVGGSVGGINSLKKGTQASKLL